MFEAVAGEKGTYVVHVHGKVHIVLICSTRAACTHAGKKRAAYM